ncbi:MAG: hypothetical protein RL319_1079, partial [Actinomycetota bacterium]
MTELNVIPVTGTNSYDVVIGRSLLNEVPKHLGDSVKKVL